jgi:hypothetical protein
LALFNIPKVTWNGRVANSDKPTLKGVLLSLRILAGAYATTPKTRVLALLSTGLLDVLFCLVVDRSHCRRSLGAIPELMPFVARSISTATKGA